MPGKVVDASVLGAIVFGEARAEEGKALLDEDTLFEAPLLAYELCSIARKKLLGSPFLRTFVIRALDEALASDMVWVEVDFPEVLALALETGLTTYDASYLYLSRSLGADLVTFDEQMQRVVS